MSNTFETTFGHNQGRGSNLDESRVEKHNSTPAEDRWTSGGSSMGSASATVTSDVSSKVNNILTDAQTKLAVRTGGDQSYQRQHKTCEDFNQGLSKFIANNQESTEQMHKDIMSIINQNVLTNFQNDMYNHFALFQTEMNKSIAMLSNQQGKFKVYMQTLEGLMALFNIPKLEGGIKGGLNDQVGDILEQNK